MTTPTTDTLACFVAPDHDRLALFCVDPRCRCQGDDALIRTVTSAVTLTGLRLAVEAHIAQWAARDTSTWVPARTTDRDLIWRHRCGEIVVDRLEPTSQDACVRCDEAPVLPGDWRQLYVRDPGSADA